MLRKMSDAPKNKMRVQITSRIACSTIKSSAMLSDFPKAVLYIVEITPAEMSGPTTRFKVVKNSCTTTTFPPGNDGEKKESAPTASDTIEIRSTEPIALRTDRSGTFNSFAAKPIESGASMIAIKKVATNRNTAPPPIVRRACENESSVIRNSTGIGASQGSPLSSTNSTTAHPSGSSTPNGALRKVAAEDQMRIVRIAGHICLLSSTLDATCHLSGTNFSSLQNPINA